MSAELSPTVLMGWICEDCDHAVTDEPDYPLFECADDGIRFTMVGSDDGSSNRCPSCHKFSVKVSDHGCEQCGAGEMEEKVLYQCRTCNKVYRTATEARDCAYRDAIPAEVKKTQDEERKRRLDEEHERFTQEAREKELALGLDFALEQIARAIVALDPREVGMGRAGVYLPRHLWVRVREILVEAMDGAPL